MNYVLRRADSRMDLLVPAVCRIILQFGSITENVGHCILLCVLCTVYPAVKWGPGFGWGMAKPPTVSIASCGQGGATGTHAMNGWHMHSWCSCECLAWLQECVSAGPE